MNSRRSARLIRFSPSLRLIRAADRKARNSQRALKRQSTRINSDSRFIVSSSFPPHRRGTLFIDQPNRKLHKIPKSSEHAGFAGCQTAQPAFHDGPKLAFAVITAHDRQQICLRSVFVNTESWFHFRSFGEKRAAARLVVRVTSSRRAAGMTVGVKGRAYASRPKPFRCS